MKEWIDEATGVPMCEADCADEWLQLIWSVGCDYDGFNDVDGLKSLIDELVTMSQNARTCMREGKLFSNLSESPEDK